MMAATASLSSVSHILNGRLQEGKSCHHCSRPKICLALPAQRGLAQALHQKSQQHKVNCFRQSSKTRDTFLPDHRCSGHIKHTLAEKEAKQLRLRPVRAEEEKSGGLMTERERQESDTMDAGKQGGPPSAAIIAVTSLVIILGAAAYFIPGGPTEWVKWTEEQIESAGPLAPLYFAVTYCLTTVAFIPASILTLAAGAIFGPLLGTAVVSVSSTSGAALAFLISRYAARPLVEQRLAKNERFAAVDRAISREGWKVVVLVRLSPLFPFALSNYALGLTRIDFVPYVASSWIGMLPATFAYVYLGSAGKATVDAVASGGEVAKSSPLQLGLYAVGALASLGVATLVSRIASKALSEAEAKEEE